MNQLDRIIIANVSTLVSNLASLMAKNQMQGEELDRWYKAVMGEGGIEADCRCGNVDLVHLLNYVQGKKHE